MLINANEGHVNVGADSWLGPFCLIYGNGGVDIGNNVLIAAHSSINTVSHHADRTDIPINNQGIYTDPVVIEDDVWLGLNVSVLQGVRIGKGSIIGAGAVVNKDIPPYSIAVGIPARVIRQRAPSEPRPAVE
ncbi:MAG: acyltransferase [Gammaproteobacteria bacterium]|nr:acyltransferase [Gammaproteobacteria bacterium]